MRQLRRSTGPVRYRVLLAGLVLGLSACGGAGETGDAHAWRRLAHGFTPSPAPAEAGARRDRSDWSEPTDRRPAQRVIAGGSVHERRFEARLRRQDWTRRGARLWSAPRVLSTPAVQGDAAPRLAGSGAAFRFMPRSEVDERFMGMPSEGEIPLDVEELITRHIKSAGFALSIGLVYLVLPEGEEPPEELVLSETASLGHEENGAWRVLGTNLVADGIAVLPGGPERTEVDVAAGTSLRFSTVALGAGGLVEAPPRVRFRVSLDGKVLLDHEQAMSLTARPIAHEIRFERGDRGRGQLTWEVEGDPCLAAFLTPTLGPTAVGSIEERPWPRPPDIVFLLADTFRADNLAAWGGDARLAPRLNALAGESRRFLGARTVATWTLPAHAAFLSGLYPHETGVTAAGTRLAAPVRTLAEHLGAGGYRTVAITGGGYVSRRNGLAQGFEWFEEQALGLPNGVHGHAAQHAPTIERIVSSALERSAADDGRPLFLFVHTYRAHDPYHVTAETRARLPHLDFSGVCVDLKAELRSLKDEMVRGEPFAGRRKALCDGLETLYRGACADVDRRLGGLVASLADQGRFPGGVLVFTSDHGESFGEHGVFGHSTGTWGEQARVPLFIRAPGVEAGARDEPVSLISLPFTLSRLAGLAPDASWSGHDLLGPEPGRLPVTTYQLGERPSDVALFDAQHKLILRDGGDGRRPLRHAYELSGDPQERRNESDSRWARKLLKTWRGTLAEIEELQVAEERAATDADQRAQLRALGYSGDE